MDKDTEDNEKIRRVAKRIQEILVEEKCAMIPTISIQIIEDEKKPVIETI